MIEKFTFKKPNKYSVENYNPNTSKVFSSRVTFLRRVGGWGGGTGGCTKSTLNEFIWHN